MSTQNVMRNINQVDSDRLWLSANQINPFCAGAPAVTSCCGHQAC